MTDPRKIDEKGFTLIEVMIAVAVSVILGGSLYMIFTYNHKLFKKQEIISNLQQNLRASMYLLENDIRMAGYDPLNTANAQILQANNQRFQFQMDLNENGDPFNDVNDNSVSIDSGRNPNEQVTYCLIGGSFGLNRLARQLGNSPILIPMIENIEALDFRFFDINDNPLNPDDGDINTPDAVSGSQLQDIRSVEITLISRSDRAYRGQTDTRKYKNLREDMVLVDADTDQNRHYYRKTLSKRIQLRNM